MAITQWKIECEVSLGFARFLVASRMAFTRSAVRSRLAPPNFPTDTSRNARLVASSRTFHGRNYNRSAVEFPAS
jgi:hypothetical protein